MVGAIALAFLITGYQTALFVHRAAVTQIIANSDAPDTVYIMQHDAVQDTVRKKVTRSPEAVKIKSEHVPRSYETFRFNPNTIDLDGLMRLGFSQKQAQSIVNYRDKGGRFRRKEDFAKSYVVADSVYRRLEAYIEIPLLDINLADSAAFDGLPGIGPHFAAKMVEHRKSLCGYSYPEQLMDIYGFSPERYAGLEDIITLSPPRPYPLWSLPADSLSLHPYIGRQAARAIVLYRQSTPQSEWNLKGLLSSNILSKDNAAKLARCSIADP